MNEKLKEAVRAWGDVQGDGKYQADYEFGGHEYALLAAAARGEIPGFRLLDEDAAKDAERYRFMRDQNNPLEQINQTTKTNHGVSCYHIVGEVRELKHGAELDEAIDAAMLTAYKEEQK